MLRTREGRAMSDRAVAREVGCHKIIVREVRSELIAAGRLPRNPRYRAGAAGRGGYVFDASGRMVREVVWLEAEAEKLSLRVGRMIGRLLRTLKERHRHGRA